MANEVLIFKAVVATFQLGLIILLIKTAIYLEGVKHAKDLLDLAKNTPGFQTTEELDKVYTRYAILLSVVILSTIKFPLISAGIFLNHILILFGSILMDICIGSLYIINARSETITDSSTVSYSTESWWGFVCSVACGLATFRLIANMPEKARNSIITKTVDY